MPTLFHDELQEIEATLNEARAFVAAEPQMCRRLDNAIELVKDLARRAGELSSGGKVQTNPPPAISLFPVAATQVPQEFLDAFKLASEMFVKAGRRLEFLETQLVLRMESWKIQAEYAPDSQARGLLRAKIEEIERILDNARA